MPARPESTPLAAAALGFLQAGVTATELADRFAGVGATISEQTAQSLLDELSGMGLARVVHGSNSSGRYTPTPLGGRLADSTFVGTKVHADLLAELEQMRTELVATVAHELRTPLTAVRTSVSLLLDPSLEPSPEQRLTLLETIDRNATRMQRVVGDILDLARFHAGGVQLQLRRFDAAELARSAIASVEPLAEQRNQAINLTVPRKPAWVFGDFRRLEQALVNLLSNAGRYSPEGSTIGVEVAVRGADVGWTVSDRGRGISPGDRARLFERYFVARKDRSEANAGIGLGLPITLAIVQAHDGRIDVHSRPGRGSRFTIVVPAAGPSDLE
ncbi:MAG: sensor histidine kinase [Candidatus Limnocylindrales bacterium]